MKTQLEIENKIAMLKPLLKSKFNVNKIGYFGSFARNQQTESSDLDVLVEFSKPIGWEFFDLQDLLEKELNTKIDLVTINALKEQIKNSIINQVRYV